MKGNRYLIIFALVFLFIVFQDIIPTGGQSPSPTPEKQEVTYTRSPSFVSYAAQPLQNTWPQSNTDSDVYTHTEDMLATNYYLVLDVSGSMKGNSCSPGGSKIHAAVDAISHFLTRLPADANFGLAVFHKSVLKELLPLGRDNRTNVIKLVSNLAPDGGTPLDRAIDFGHQKLIEQGQKQSGYGEYHLVVVTDGVASEGHNPERAVESMLQQAPVALHTIGFCIAETHSLNQPGYTVYRSANDPVSLKQGLEAVLAESPEFDISSFAQ